MRTLWLAALMGLCLLGSCAKKEPAKQVTIYMYSEYIDPKILEEFEQKTGIKARVDVYEASEEMIAKMAQGGASQYDLVVVSDAHVPTLVARGLVQPLQLSKVPNRSNIDKPFQNPPFDRDGQYTLPYQWGTVGLIYQEDKVKAQDVSWALIFDPARQPGRFMLMDSMRDMLGIALLHQGHSMNSRKPRELAAAGELLIMAKKSDKCLGFEGGVGGKDRVASGDADLAVAYNGDAMKVCRENDKIGFAVPPEGGIVWVDVMMVTSKAPNVEGAHQFMNYILDGKVGAQLSNFNRYPTPNAAAMPMINAEDRQDPGIYPTPEMMKKLQYLVDVEKDTDEYSRVWTAVKAR